MARILIGNIMGPQGPQGIQGIQGLIGPQGPQGPLPPLINNALATTPGVAALDSAMGSVFGSQITQLNSDLTWKIAYDGAAAVIGTYPANVPLFWNREICIQYHTNGDPSTLVALIPDDGKLGTRGYRLQGYETFQESSAYYKSLHIVFGQSDFAITSNTSWGTVDGMQDEYGIIIDRILVR